MILSHILSLEEEVESKFADRKSLKVQKRQFSIWEGASTKFGDEQVQNLR